MATARRRVIASDVAPIVSREDRGYLRRTDFALHIREEKEGTMGKFTEGRFDDVWICMRLRVISAAGSDVGRVTMILQRVLAPYFDQISEKNLVNKVQVPSACTLLVLLNKPY
jgi:hypothetical protein